MTQFFNSIEFNCAHVTSHYLKYYVAVIDFYSTFHVFDEAANPYKLSRLISLDPISHGNDGLILFYYRTALSMDISHCIISAFSA